MRTLRPWLIAAVAAPLIASLTGCVVVPAHRYRGYDAGYGAGYSSGYDGGGYGYAGGPPQAGYIWIEAAGCVMQSTSAARRILPCSSAA